MGCICLVFFSMLISTVIKDGDVRRAIMIMYPVWLWRIDVVAMFYI